MTDPKEYLCLAKVAEQTERYDDMAKYMEEYTKQCADHFTAEVRNLLSVAFKNVVGARRSSWRILTSSNSSEKTEKPCCVEYRKKVVEELRSICHKVLVSKMKI